MDSIPNSDRSLTVPLLFSHTARAGSMRDQGDGTHLLTLERIDERITTFIATVLSPEDHSSGARRHVNVVHDSPPATFRDVSLFIDDVAADDAANKSKFSMIKAA